jgi:cell division protein FtsQ
MSGGPAKSQLESQPPGSPDGPGAGPPERGRPPARPRTPWRAAFFTIAIVAIVAGVGWALLGSRFLVVRSIQVTGTHLVPRSEVLAAAAIPAGLPLIRVNTAAAAHRIAQITQIESAHVSRAWPDGVTISVHERIPVLAVASGGGYELIDKFGVPVEQVTRPPAGMPDLTMPGSAEPAASLRGSPAVYAAASVLRELPASLTGQVTQVTAPDAADVSLTLANGDTIVWGGPDRAAEKAKELTVLMQTHARSYDVSAPGSAMTGG